MKANTTVQKLAQMGCGNEILNSVIERSNINAAVTKCRMFLNYYKKGAKSGIYTTEDAVCGLMKYYNELLSIEHLAHKYNELWLEKFSKIKLQTEKFINSNQTQHGK